MKATSIAVLMATMALGAASACSSNTKGSKAPTVVCGHSIRTAPLATNAIDATKPGTITITKLHKPGWAFVWISTDCAHGGDVGAVPDSSVQFADQVASDDGHVAALVVEPLGRDAELTVTRPGGQSTHVKFHLANLPPCKGNGALPC